MRIYIAGPMTGLPDFNRAAFNAAAWKGEYLKMQASRDAAEARVKELEDGREVVAQYQYSYHNHGTGCHGGWLNIDSKAQYDEMQNQYKKDSDFSFRELFTVGKNPVTLQPVRRFVNGYSIEETKAAIEDAGGSHVTGRL